MSLYQEGLRYNAKKRVLLDQTEYRTTERIPTVSKTPLNDILLLENQIRTVSTSVATDVSTSVVNTTLAQSPLDLVSSKNNYMRITGSNTPSTTLTLQAKNGNGSDVTMRYKGQGYGEHIFENEQVTGKLTLSGNSISTKDSTANQGIILEGKGTSAAFRFKAQSTGYMDVSITDSTSTITASQSTLYIQASGANQTVNIPSYLSLPGLGYFYGELPAGNNSMTLNTDNMPNFATNVTNTFNNGLVSWVNNTGFTNNLGYTITVLVQVYWGSLYAVSNGNHINVDSWFHESGGGTSVRWGRNARHYEYQEAVMGHDTAIIRLPHTKSIKWHIYPSATIDIYGSGGLGTGGYEIGNQRCYFIVQQIA